MIITKIFITHLFFLRSFVDLGKTILLSAILLCSFTKASAQVGIENTNPKTSLDLNGAISLSGSSQLNLVDGNNNNINLDASPYSLYQIAGPTALFYVTGITPLSGTDGQQVVIQNSTSQIMYIAHENSSSTAANRIFIAGERDLMLRGRHSSVTLQYNTIQSRWIVLNKYMNVETYYTNVITALDGFKTTYTLIAPSVTANSGVNVSLVNNHGLPDAEKYNIIVEYVEAQDGIVVFRINNKNPDTQPGPQVTFVLLQYAFTYFIN